MNLLDWRIGGWLFVLGLIGVLLPTFEAYVPPGGGPMSPVWPFYILMAAGLIVTVIGVYNALQNRKHKQP